MKVKCTKRTYNIFLKLLQNEKPIPYWLKSHFPSIMEVNDKEAEDKFPNPNWTRKRSYMIWSNYEKIFLEREFEKFLKETAKIHERTKGAIKARIEEMYFGGYK